MTLSLNHNPRKEILSKPARRRVALVIVDGWGLGAKDYSNPIYIANPQNIDFIKHNFASASLQASGIAIGLPWEEEGNSEIGHLTIGAGRIIYQDFPRISQAIKNGSFFRNKALLEAINYVKAGEGRSLNLVGLLGEANIHSSLEHLKALVKMAEENNILRLNLHLITDGRDSSPGSALKLLDELPQESIASLSGRFFAMDRDNHLPRTEEAFKAMTGLKPLVNKTPKQVLEENYNAGVTDELLEPAALGSGSRSVKKSDAVIFFNFREERMRQLVKMFAEKMPGLKMVSFTEYGPDFLGVASAFPRPKIADPLGKIISDAGLTQLRVAESEKAAHITFFLNAQEENPFPGEYRVIIPSRNIPSHDKYPEMMAKEITERVLSAIEEKIYDFIAVNYANPDIVGHTGNYDAVLQAVSFVDKEIGRLKESALKNETTLIITSDHGNAEKMLDPQTGEKETKHNSSPVPFYLVAEEWRRKKDDLAVEQIEKETVGTLGDIAPTVLELLGIPKLDGMTGQSLLPFLQ